MGKTTWSIDSPTTKRTTSKIFTPERCELKKKGKAKVCIPTISVGANRAVSFRECQCIVSGFGKGFSEVGAAQVACN